ncbi:MAG: GC-type dockerin domain-anchored protein [Phycisphaerales bacterium]
MGRRLACAGIVVGVATIAQAGWPTDPSESLVAGMIEGSFGPRLSLSASEDGSVWLAWQDQFCIDGVVRLQRIAPDGSLLSPLGLAVQEDPTCGFLVPPTLVQTGEGVAVGRWGSFLVDDPLVGVGSQGSIVWPNGFTTLDDFVLGGAATLENGDALVLTKWQRTIRVDRLGLGGAPVWAIPVEFESPSGSNLRLLGVVPLVGGGSDVYWDTPLSYDRLVFVARISADGTIIEQPTRIVERVLAGTDASSRHSDPKITSDGTGGSIVVWAKAREQGTTPAPLLMQQIDASGELVFPPDGVRISLGAKRQFDPQVSLDEQTGDVVVVWRDGQLEQTTVRAQRMSSTGQRLWGDEGIEVASLEPLLGEFEAVWFGDRLSIALTDSQGIEAVSFDGNGVVSDPAWVISESAAVGGMVATRSGDAMVVAWQSDDVGLDDLVLAQRVRADGSLGAGCSGADRNADGQLNFFDVSGFVAAFIASDASADLAEPEGVFNFFDVSAYIDLFSAGCP